MIHDIDTDGKGNVYTNGELVGNLQSEEDAQKVLTLIRNAVMIVLRDEDILKRVPDNIETESVGDLNE